MKSRGKRLRVNRSQTVNEMEMIQNGTDKMPTEMRKNETDDTRHVNVMKQICDGAHTNTFSYAHMYCIYLFDSNSCHSS